MPDGIALFPAPDLQIGLSRAPQEASLLHSHDFTEITVIESGFGSHRYEGADCRFQAGDVFVVQPNHAHQYTNAQQLVVSNILFYSDGSIPLLDALSQLPAYRTLFQLEPAFRQSESTAARLHLGVDTLRNIILLITRLENALNSREPSSTALATVCFLQLIRDLCEAYDKNPPSMGASMMQVSKAISHIEEHFCDPIKIGDMADLVNMSQRSFQRHFQRATGMSAAHYIMRRRIDEARKLLQTGVNVTETAFEVGFEDSNYFSQVFHKITGIPPKKFQLAASGKGQNNDGESAVFYHETMDRYTRHAGS